MDSSIGDYPNAIPIQAKEYIVETKDVLDLGEEDSQMIQIADNYAQKAKSYYAQIRLKDRQDRNFSYLFAREGNSIDNLLNKRSIYADNVLYEIESTLKPLATSKDPDILVYPASDDPEKVKSSEDLTLALQHSINTRDLKEIKAMAFKHLPVYFIGAVKYRWNPQKGKNGDYEFMVVHPQNLVLDNNAKGRDINKMDFVIEYQEISVQELCMQFPEKKEDLLNKLINERKITSKNAPNSLATKVKIMEIWFKYYQEKDGKFTKVSAVMWKYQDVVFKKMKNPNWDWEGETNYFSYKEPIEADQIMQAMQQNLQIPGFESQQMFHNYFEEPEFPYIFIGYDDWHTMVYDETSRIEQMVKMQENVDVRGNQIKKMLNRAMGKHIFSTSANLKADDIEEMDWEDMDQAIIIDGPVGDMHAMAVSDQPSPAMVNDYGNTRQIMFQKAHVNAITGALQSDTATSNQIAREANFTYADDLVDATINYMSEKMARAIMQMIKLRYTEEHFVRLIGQEGKVVFQKLHRDMIEDGMEVTITASGVDKLQAQNRAMDMAKLQLIDPLTFYEDIGAKNAPERVKRLLTFMTNPAQYQAEYVMGLATPQQQGDALNGAQPPQDGSQQAMLDIQMMQQGQMPQVPPQVDQAYASAIAQFIQAPEFGQLPPEIQQQVLQFAQQVQQALQQSEQQQMQAPAQFGAPKGTGSNPMQPPQQPSPTDTSNVAITPPTGAVQGSPRGI